jgi:hypothetical protein
MFKKIAIKNYMYISCNDIFITFVKTIFLYNLDFIVLITLYVKLIKFCNVNKCTYRIDIYS